MRTSHSARGFTLSELIATMGIIAVLAAMLFPVFATARETSRVVRCAANLHQIGVAAQLYCQDHSGPPMSRLPLSLASYVDDPSAFVCPNDHTTKDSYSPFFVGRHRTAKASEFVVGCPRHNKGDKYAAVCGKGDSEVGRAGLISHDGVQIGPGEFVKGGVLTFEDGSRVDVQSSLSIAVLTSVNGEAGLHTVVWIPQGQSGSVDCTVTPGSRFEVVTSEVVAAVRGTQFSVYVDGRSKHKRTYVYVHKGKVVVKSRKFPKMKELKAGQSTSVGNDSDSEKTNNGNGKSDNDDLNTGPGPWVNWDGSGSIGTGAYY